MSRKHPQCSPPRLPPSIIKTTRLSEEVCRPETMWRFVDFLQGRRRDRLDYVVHLSFNIPGSDMASIDLARAIASDAIVSRELTRRSRPEEAGISGWLASVKRGYCAQKSCGSPDSLSNLFVGSR